MRSWGSALVLGCAWLAGCGGLPPGHAESAGGLDHAMAAAQRARMIGPAMVRLGANSYLRLGPDRVFIPRDEGGRLLDALGEARRPRLLGVVVSGAPAGADYAAIYGLAPKAGFPDFEVVGWRASRPMSALLPY